MEKYWVIFDISTMPEYYQDVHNLLALPRNSYINYEYRCKFMDDKPSYVTSEATKMIEDNFEYPKDILLMYCQHMNYVKGNPVEYGSNENSVFIATRVAEIVDVSIMGYNMHFQMKLKGYPDNNDLDMFNFIEQLKTNNLTPFNYNFVFLSENKIEKTQFNGDVFWRISDIKQKADTITILWKNRRNVIVAKDNTKLDFSICSFTSNYDLNNKKINIKTEGQIELNKNEISARQYTIDSFSINICNSGLSNLV